MIDTVIFDIGNVLMGWDFRAYLKDIFSDEETIDAVERAIIKSGLWAALDEGADTNETFKKMQALEPGYEKEIEYAFFNAGGSMKKWDYALPWIQELQKRGYRVLYLSNYSKHSMECDPGALDFVPYMDGGVFSSLVKVAKPDTRIYKLLFERYDLDPSRCVFIDDNEENIRVGQSLGLHCILFRGYESARAKLEEILDDR